MHDPLQKVTVKFVFKHIACLQYALVLHLDFLVDLDGKVLYVFLQIDDAPVQSNQLVVEEQSVTILGSGGSWGQKFVKYVVEWRTLHQFTL